VNKLAKENKDVKVSTDFLVPFTNTLVNLLSSINLTKWSFIRELKKLHINNVSDNDGIMESFSTILEFEIHIVYEGTRNFILKIRGISRYSGFSIMVTNKGMLVHDDVTENPTSSARLLKEDFLANYKSPYLVTKTFLKFLDKS